MANVHSCTSLGPLDGFGQDSTNTSMIYQATKQADISPRGGQISRTLHVPHVQHARSHVRPHSLQTAVIAGGFPTYAEKRRTPLFLADPDSPDTTRPSLER